MADVRFFPSKAFDAMKKTVDTAPHKERWNKLIAEKKRLKEELENALNRLDKDSRKELSDIFFDEQKNRKELSDILSYEDEMRLLELAKKSPEVGEAVKIGRESVIAEKYEKKAEDFVKRFDVEKATMASSDVSIDIGELDVQKCLNNMYSALLPGSGKSFPGDFPMEKFPKDFDMDKYVKGLCNFRGELLEAEVKAAEKGEKIQFSLRDNKNFQEMLRIDDELNKMLTSDDIRIRESARAAKDEAWRRATERSAREKIDRLKELNPEASEKFAKNREKAAEEWIKSSQKEFQSLFGRPDNMFGMFVLASLAPSMAALFMIPVAFPFLLSIGNIFAKLSADARTEDIRNEKLSIEKRVVMDASVATALRAVGSAAERNGLSPGEGLNMAVNMLSNPDSVIGKFEEALHEMHENGVKFDSPEATKIFIDIAKNLREANAPGIDVIGEYLKAEICVNGDVLEYAVKPNVGGESSESTINNVMAFLKGPDEDIKKYFVTEEKGAGDHSSIRPGEAVVLCKALAEGWPGEAEKMKKLCEELALRILPSSAVLLDGGDRRYFMDKILRSHGDCFRTELPDADEGLFHTVSPDEKDVDNLSMVIRNGKKYGQASPYIDNETLKTTSLEHVIIGAAEGRARYQDEMRRRAREEQESFRQELVHCCDRMVHPVMHEMEEYANVGFGETTKEYVKEVVERKKEPEEMTNGEAEEKKFFINGEEVKETVWNRMTEQVDEELFKEHLDVREVGEGETGETDADAAKTPQSDEKSIGGRDDDLKELDETDANLESVEKNSKIGMKPVEEDKNTEISSVEEDKNTEISSIVINRESWEPLYEQSSAIRKENAVNNNAPTDAVNFER